ncbi:MAG TPA: hypothetical protein VFE14_00420 [Micromonosporaceae bacterium]|jgi:hypothetical protein|nr:hypothetical protein [Micromonosporaceae bacterium]
MRRTKIGTVLTALALALAGAMVTVTPAQAAPGGQNCYQFPDGHTVCAPLAINWPWPRWCIVCDLYTEHVADPVINPEFSDQVATHFAQGMSALGQAAATTDPARKATLRATAFQEFTSAARAAGGSRLSVRRVGWLDRVTGRLEPEPDPWLWKSGVDLADGVGWLQLSFADPANANRYRALAMAQFDEAYTEIADKRVIAG